MALSGMALDVMTAVGAPHLDGCNGGAMLEPLAGLWKGEAVHIVGNGPMADRPPRGLDIRDITCNGAISRWYTDIWLVCEARAHTQPWFWQQQDFAGEILWDAAMWSPVDNPDPLTEEKLLDHYSPEFLLRVRWFLRHGVDKGVSGSGWNTREWRDGLLQYLPLVDAPGDPNPYAPGEVVGGCGMAAIHLAHLMGASEIHTWGMPLSWKEGEAQHADGTSPWTEGSHPVNRPYWLLLSANNSIRQTTPFLSDCAAAIKWFVVEANIALRDHSGGLLS